MKHRRLFIGGIIGIAILLKWFLANKRIYIDEAVYSWWMWHMQLDGQSMTQLATQVKHPLYFFLILLFDTVAQINGLGPFLNLFAIQKAFSVFAYFIAAYGVYRLSPTRPYAAALLFLLSPFIALHTDFGIVEPLLIVQTIWLWVVTRALIAKFSTGYAIAFLLLSFGLALTKTTASIPLLAGILFFMFNGYIQSRKDLYTYGTIQAMALFTNLYVAFFTQVSEETTRVFSFSALSRDIPGRIAYLNELYWYFLPVTLTVIGIAASIILLNMKWRLPKRGEWGTMPALYSATFVIASGTFFCLTDLVPRYSLYQLLPVFMLILHTSLWKSLRKQALLLFICLDMIAFISIYTLPSSPRIIDRDRTQYRDVFTVDYNTQLIRHFRDTEYPLRVHNYYYAWSDLMMAGALPLDWQQRDISFWNYTDISKLDLQHSCATKPRPLALIYGYSERTPDYDYSVSELPGKELMLLHSDSDKGSSITYRKFECN